MLNINIGVINEYSPISDSDVQLVVDALQAQLIRDFAPVWGINANVTYYPNGQEPPQDYWQLIILDNTDQANDLGYHDYTSTGLPLGKIFVGTDLKFNTSWTVTASHELLEMIADPAINKAVLRQYDDGSACLFWFEVCDPCEDDDYSYEIDNIKVSNFLYPAWFEDFHPAGTQYDHRCLINQPFAVLPKCSGNIYKMDSWLGWAQVPAANETLTYRMRAHVGSRRERRRTPRYQWLRSKI